MAYYYQMLSTLFKRPAPMMDPRSILPNISKYVAQEWTQKVAQYQHWWNWYDGTVMAETIDKEGKVLKYPLRINPVQWIANKHGGGMYGETPDDASSLVSFSFKNDEGRVDDVCRDAARIINRVWADSNGSALQLENGILSQFLGGCVYKVNWQDKNPWLRYGVRVTKLLPDYFLPIWSMESPEDLAEAYAIFYITKDEAEDRYGIDVGSRPYVIYSEHWTPEEFDVKVDGKTPTKDCGFITEGKNPFGMVPMVYIPHTFRIDGHYGASHVPGVEGLIQELNSRMADRGDGVKEANLNRPVGRNITTGVKVRTIGEGWQFLDIGGGMPGSQRDPDMFSLEPSVVKSGPISREYTDDLWGEICNDAETPMAAWGIDVSSQRSGTSREFDLWPLMGHYRRERIQHRIGLIRVARIIGMMVNAKRPDDFTDEMLDLDPRTKWSKMVPPDRAAKVEEMVARKGVDLVSTENAVMQLADGEDVDEEIERIQQKLEDDLTRQDEQAKQQQNHAMTMQKMKIGSKAKE